MNNFSLLLDTHIWIWLINGENSLSKKLIKAINETAQKNALFISAISLWEVSMLEAKGKIAFERPCIDWINSALKAPGINLVGLNPSIAVESCNLPNSFHGDPADRIIIATSRIEGHTLVTYDKKIQEYSENHYVNVWKELTLT